MLLHPWPVTDPRALPFTTSLSYHHLPSGTAWRTCPSSDHEAKSHRTNPDLQGEVYKGSLNRTQQFLGAVEEVHEKPFLILILLFYTRVNQEPIYWRQQFYLSVNAKVIWKQHQLSCARTQHNLELNPKLSGRCPVAFRGILTRLLYMGTAVPSSANSSKNGDYILLKWYPTDFPFLCNFQCLPNAKTLYAAFS